MSIFSKEYLMQIMKYGWIDEPFLNKLLLSGRISEELYYDVLSSVNKEESH